MTLNIKCLQEISPVMTKVIPIILSGGSGKRLWPISRKIQPKPFVVVNGKPLILHSVNLAKLFSNQSIIVTNKEYYFLTNYLISNEFGTNSNKYILEPESKDTATAVALAIKYIIKEFGADTVCLVLAADHLISDEEKFVADVQLGIDHTINGDLVVFGVKPHTAETGYGYIEVLENSKSPQKVLKFTEKPNIDIARKYLKDNKFYWNSGIFCFRAYDMANNFMSHSRDIWDAAGKAIDESSENDNIINISNVNVAKSREISFDYAVIEKLKNIKMIPASFDWSDVGTWDSLAASFKQDKNGNSKNTENQCLLVDTKNTHISSKSNTEKLIATVGIDDLVIVDEPNALLVMKRSENQKIKDVEEILNKEIINETLNLPSIVPRPWGSYSTIKNEAGFQVKIITVYPGAKLSLQFHSKRSEHWVIVKGEAEVQIGDEKFRSGVGQYHFIDNKKIHRLSNIGETNLVVVEIQLGGYLGEDDITRIDDKYGRHEKKR